MDGLIPVTCCPECKEKFLARHDGGYNSIGRRTLFCHRCKIKFVYKWNGVFFSLIEIIKGRKAINVGDTYYGW